MSKIIAVVTNANDRCGIHGYAISAVETLRYSTKYQYNQVNIAGDHYISVDQAIGLINGIEADAIIYNWCPVTMEWLNNDVVAGVNKPQFTMSGHDHQAKFTGIKHNFMVQPHFVAKENYTALTRPLRFVPDVQYKTPGDVLNIGTFGFDTGVKGIVHIAELLRDTFPTEKVKFNLRNSEGKFKGFIPGYGQASIAWIHEHAILPPNIELNVQVGYIDTQENLIRWLNSNDLNIFLHDPRITRNAVSSSLDHALSALKPIAVSQSCMFDHVRHIPELFVNENNSLKDIIARGIDPLIPLLESWTPWAYLDCIEPYLEKHL